jgi:hypothetical protein
MKWVVETLLTALGTFVVSEEIMVYVDTSIHEKLVREKPLSKKWHLKESKDNAKILDFESEKAQKYVEKIKKRMKRK